MNFLSQIFFFEVPTGKWINCTKIIVFEQQISWRFFSFSNKNAWSRFFYFYLEIKEKKGVLKQYRFNKKSRKWSSFEQKSTKKQRFVRNYDFSHLYNTFHLFYFRGVLKNTPQNVLQPRHWWDKIALKVQLSVS